MSDISIVVPHRGAGIGLWATIESCDAALRGSKVVPEFVIVSNGCKLDSETATIVKHLKNAYDVVHVHSDGAMTPPEARDAGVKKSSGRILCFFDNHCVVSDKYFDRVLLDFDKHGMDVLHSTTSFFTGEGLHYHYNISLAHNFWGTGCKLAHHPTQSYKIAMAGHGGFCVSAETYDTIGGYGPAGLFSGYGGEEPAFDLKAWRMGRTVWLDPLLVHRHYPGGRNYIRHYTDEYYTNCLVAALVVGGEKWAEKVFSSFVNNRHQRLRAQKRWFDIYTDAYERGAVYSKDLDKVAKYSLDEVLLMFKSEGVIT